MAIFSKIFGDSDTRFIKSVQPLVDKINSLEPEFEKLKKEDFPKKTEEFKGRLGGDETLDDLLPEAFALAREAAKRTLNQRHFDVQLIGGIALHQGKIAEMKTGEGKTLAATLPVYLNALEGKGVHVVTVNDYLARRDTQWMGQIYSLLGLSVGVINSQNTSYLYDPGHKEIDKDRDELGSFKVFYDFLRPCMRREAYEADITYGTNNEFGFDYLRDNLAHSREQLVQRGHHYTIVDEVDSILIDEARTPLIISAPAEESEDFYKTFSRIARQLKPDTDYEVDEKLKAVTLTDAGIEKAENLLGVENIYTEKGIKYVHHLETATRAQALFERDKDYVVKEGEIIIVDPFTGRLQPGRRWSEGLHQAIEAKEGVAIKKESRTVASITYQNYFRFYGKLSGMTGTAKTSQEEFFKVYGLEVISVPTNEPVIRNDQNDLIFQTEKGKLEAISRQVKKLHQKGQPVLIGTISIEKNELLSAYLKREGVPHEILNAKNHEREGEIIAQAGAKGAVTIATNMAGRGVDIKLGGSPATKEQYEEIKNLGGLFVLGTERHEARRIDNQLRGRSGRQGDPGASQFFVSLEDDLMRVFGGDRVKAMMGRFGVPEDQPIENRFITRALEKSQEKVEGFNFDARKHVLEYDNVLNTQRETIYTRRRKMLEAKREDIEEFLEELLGELSESNGERLPESRRSAEWRRGGSPGVKEPFDFRGSKIDIKELKKTIAEKKEEVGAEAFYEAVRRIVLYVTDMLWMEHLETMDYIRSSVGLRAYGQRDPLVEYKKEGRRLFRQMEDAFREQVVNLIRTIKKAPSAEEHKGEQERLVAKHEQKGQFAFSPPRGEVPAGRRGASSVSRPVEARKAKVGRNDPCPCGAINPNTGKVYKYKKCGLISAPHHKG